MQKKGLLLIKVPQKALYKALLAVQNLYDLLAFDLKQLNVMTLHQLMEDRDEILWENI